jgi:hypothetical protein
VVDYFGTGDFAKIIAVKGDEPHIETLRNLSRRANELKSQIPFSEFFLQWCGLNFPPIWLGADAPFSWGPYVKGHPILVLFALFFYLREYFFSYVHLPVSLLSEIVCTSLLLWKTEYIVFKKWSNKNLFKRTKMWVEGNNNSLLYLWNKKS